MKPCNVFHMLGAAPSVAFAVLETFGEEYVPQEPISRAYSGQVALGRVIMSPVLASLYPGTGLE